MEIQELHWNTASLSARHRGQYRGAGFLTGFGLRFRHVAQRYLLPLTAVFGRSLLPVRGVLFMAGGPLTHYSGIAATKATSPADTPMPSTTKSTRHPRVVLL